jgi:hypothetical protein
MALWSASQQNWTPVAVADTTNFTNSGYLAIQGGSSTQRLEVIEVYIGGLAASAAPAQHLFGRDSTVGATSLSGGLNAAFDPATAALGAPPNIFSTSTTKPQRSSTLGALLTPAFNAQGGVIRWKVNRGAGEGVMLQGNTASFGELSLSHASTGTPGLVSSHIIYEPL